LLKVAGSGCRLIAHGLHAPVLKTDSILLTLRHQTRIVSHISNRDLVKRIAAGALILGFCWYGGIGASLVVVAALILLTEVVMLFCTARLPEKDEDVSLWLIVTVWASNMISTVVYLWPGVLLVDQTSVALLMTGFMWMFGIFVHISNTYVALPLYNWSQMIPGFLTATIAIWRASQGTYAVNEQAEWYILMAFMIVYASNTFETLNQQKDTQKALNAARAEATARLMALEHMTRHDGLTGLLNRQGFDLSLEQLLACRKPDEHVAVFLLDLDGFKPINDTHSHDAGDTVLISVARRLGTLVGSNGLAARLGGDEFALAVPNISSDRAAIRFASRIIREVELPIAYGEKLLRIAGSVGIGMTGIADGTVSALCSGADQAMFRAKADNSGKCVLFNPSEFPARLSLKDRQAMVEALRTGQIRPHYQPKVLLETGRIFGFEALARWDHPTLGLLAPATFLPQINDLGLQGDFLSAMALQVLSDVAGMVADGLDPGEVSMNLPEIALATYSGRQDLDRILATHPSALRHITFEITEGVFIGRAAEMIQDSITHFRRAGVRVSLDDFGTGFASFQHLRQLEFDELKIDPSFVRDLVHDPAAAVLVGGFLSIARGLDVVVIAEGVETEAQRNLLIQMGCQFVQGHLFGKAMPLNETRIHLATESISRKMTQSPPDTVVEVAVS
jgi:diguanylate cyclase